MLGKPPAATLTEATSDDELTAPLDKRGHDGSVMMRQSVLALAPREFKVGLGVGTAITIVVGLVFVFLGASRDDAPAIIPSVPLWIGALLAVESCALAAAWGGLALYFGSRPDAVAPAHRPIVLGLLAGAFVGVLFVIVLLLLDVDGNDKSGRRRRRGAAGQE